MKKTLCILLTIAVMVCFMPAMAFASTPGGSTVPPGTSQDPTTPGTDQDSTTPGTGQDPTTPGGDTPNIPSGGGGTAIPPEVVKNTTGTTTADITTDVKDGKATTTIDAATAGKIVDGALANKSEVIIINAVTNKAGVKTAEVSIPADTVKSIAEKTEATVIVKTDVGDVNLDKVTMDTIALSAVTGDVKLIINTVKSDENQLVLELSIVTSTGAVKDFKGGAVKVTVKLSNELKTKNPVCVYIDDNDKYTKVDGALNADGTYTFTTGHFSTYAIMAKDAADKAIADQVNALIKEVKLTARTSKTAKKNIKVTVNGDVTALKDAGYTVKYKFYRSTKKASKYTAKVTKDTNTYTNTIGKKGTKYYYKARVLVYDGDTLVGQTALKQCKYGARIWTK